MDIAMVDQSIVDAHLQRVNRFVDNVNRFQAKLDSFMQSHSSEMAQPVQTVQTVQQPVQQPVQTNVAAATFEDPTPTQKVTADDIDLDAILDGIDLGAGMTL